MGLEQIIEKQTVIGTPSASDLAANPSDYEARFKIHVSTYVSIADLNNKWESIINNLEKGKSSTGLIYSDTGYGKTATAAALWQYAGSRDIVAVPPFMWNSMADMLLATHGWVCYRLKQKRPDFISELQKEYEMLIESSSEDLAIGLSQGREIPIDYARKTVQALKEEGKILESISANGLIKYLRTTVSILLKSGYKGLLLLPDEFELFAGTNPDIARNFQELKDFIFPIYQEGFPIGCIVSSYGRTVSEISMREPHMLARFNKPEGSQIDLERVYGQKENGLSFAHKLWERLSVTCNLSANESKAISSDVLDALGQFLGHQRTTSIISGPRSVVATYRRAAIQYSEKGQPYSIFDFCDDYIHQFICFNQQETDTAKSYTSIINQPIINSELRRNVVKLLCTFPDGVPLQMFQKHGISDSDRQAVVQSLLGTHVINKIIGPTIVNYKDSLEAGDQLIEILKELRNHYNPGSAETHRASVRAFVNYIIPEVFKKSIAASPTGWTGIENMESDIEPIFQMQLRGTNVREYPDRSLTVHVGTEKYENIMGRYIHSQLFSSFILDNKLVSGNICNIENNGLYLRFNIQQPINKLEIPRDISKLGDLFLPESITPSLLLSMLDYFDTEVTISLTKQTSQDAQVKFLKSRIIDELTKYFFSSGVKENAVLQNSELSQVPIGKDFVEKSLSILIRKLFPSYKSIAISNQWKKIIDTYILFLKSEQRLGVKRGVEPIKTTGDKVPSMFSINSHTGFEGTYYPNGVWRDILRVDELDDLGMVIKEGAEVRNTKKPVAVYFQLHDLEKRILEQLESNKQVILIDGKEAKSLKKPDIFKQEEDNGYLSEEIEQILKITEARGLIEQREQQGFTYICLLDIEISLTELEEKLQTLEERNQLAKSNKFIPEWEQDSSPVNIRKSMQTPGIETNEILKDSVRQVLRKAEESFKLQCAKWLDIERQNLDRKRQETAVSNIDIPKVLEQTTGNPTTEFSVLLFHDIQSDVKKAYKSVSQNVISIQNEIKNALDTKLKRYVDDRTPENAIKVAGELKEFSIRIDSKIEQLKIQRSGAESLYELFEGWRKLAANVDQYRRIISDAIDDEAGENLVERLDDEQKQIKRHLADRKLSLNDVLASHEHFRNRIEIIKGEFDQMTSNRQEKFIQFMAKIQEQLIKIIDKPNIDESYNPSDENGCYRRVREKSISKIEEYALKRAEINIQQIKTDLLKPTEVFKVNDNVEKEARSLLGKIKELQSCIDNIRNDLKVDNIEEKLPSIIESLISLRQEGEGIVSRNRTIQDHLRCDKAELSFKAQRLLNIIGSNKDRDFTELILELRQSGEQMLSNTAEIIESLEELYQKNWLNIKVSSTIIQ